MRWQEYLRRLNCSIAAILIAVGAAGRVSASGDLQALLEQAVAASYRSPVEARRLDAELRTLLRDAPDSTIEAGTYLNDCRSLIEEDGEQALAAALAGKAALDQAPDQVMQLRLELCEYAAREYLGQSSESLVGYDRAVAQAENLGVSSLEAEARFARGELRGYEGHYGDALEDMQFACRKYHELGLADEALSCVQAIAVLYFRLEDYDRAIEYLQDVIPEREARNQTHMLADALYNLARAREGKGDLEQARGIYERSQQLSSALGNETSEAYSAQALGRIFIRQNEPARALPLLDSALAVFRRLKDQDYTARLLAARAEALFMLGRSKEALASVEAAVAIYGELRQLPGLEQSYQLLARILLHGAQAERAAKTLLLERDVHAQLDLARRDESLARQRAEFDTERKEQSNRFLRSRNKLTARALEGVQRIDRLKTAVILLSALLLLMGGVFVARQLALARRLSALAMADELTGIGNRRSVLAFLDEQIRLHRASGKPLSVVLLDIDRFKQLNDLYGHAAGDQALKSVADLCQQLMRDNDKIGRTGGEEFLAVLPGAPLSDAGDVAWRLCEQVRELSLDAIDPGLRTSVSIGVSQWRADDADAQEVIKRADTALYEAKATGRNRVELSPG